MLWKLLPASGHTTGTQQLCSHLILLFWLFPGLSVTEPSTPDEIHYPPPRGPEYNVIGGAGAYTTIGARLLKMARPKAHQAGLVGWTVHEGSDMPNTVKAEIESWETEVNWIKTPDRLTTRGWNKYEEKEHRSFKYMTPKVRVDETVLTDRQLLAKSFHLICSAERCISLVKGIMKRRAKLQTTQVMNLPTISHNLVEPPLFVWEPVPDSCVESELENTLKALQYVDVVSPNQEELASLFGEPEPDILRAHRSEQMRRQCAELISRGFGKKPSAVVVRCGKDGAFIMAEGHYCSMPPYYTDQNNSQVDEHGEKLKPKVVDPTGGGNAFLGGFCVGVLDAMLFSQMKTVSLTPWECGAAYGMIAASFAIEQVGMPKVAKTDDGELWNGASVMGRMDEFLAAWPLSEFGQRTPQTKKQTTACDVGSGGMAVPGIVHVLNEPSNEKIE